MVKLETNKIPDIIFTVIKSLKDEPIDLFQIDVYIHMLINLSEKECHYLKTNRSTEVENDFTLLIQTLETALKMYEKEEFYEFCAQIFTSLEKYRMMEKN